MSTTASLPRTFPTIPAYGQPAPTDLPETNGEHGPAFVGWAIDRDYLNADAEYAEYRRVGFGQTDMDLPDPWEFSILRVVNVRTDLSAAHVIDPVRFRVLDDDGEVYYGGSIARAWLDGEEYRAFAPLEYATADAGAVELQYRDGSGEWTTL